MPLLFCEVERAELGPSLQAEFAMGVRKGREERKGKEGTEREGKEGAESWREKGRRVAGRRGPGVDFPFAWRFGERLLAFKRSLDRIPEVWSTWSGGQCVSFFS